jgi:hypothetical protein
VDSLPGSITDSGEELAVDLRLTGLMPQPDVLPHPAVTSRDILLQQHDDGKLSLRIKIHNLVVALV